uniref:Uncharacterized protein n=1 Tax=Rhizophora mucronata TaxID=61149 RepID=A0A2P2KTT2_RHIMU
MQRHNLYFLLFCVFNQPLVGTNHNHRRVENIKDAIPHSYGLHLLKQLAAF